MTDHLDKPDDDLSDPMIRTWAAKQASTSSHPRYFEATQRTSRAQEYRKAGQKEMDTLTKNKTWEYVRRSDVPVGTKIHHGMWVWVDKYDKRATMLNCEDAGYF